MKQIKELKVALVHDYLREYGGAERVVEALHELFSDAPVFVSFTDFTVTGIHAKKFLGWDIRESWLTKVPLYKKLFSPLRIFAPNYFSSFDLSDYDVVISSTNAYFSKAVTVKKGNKKALHITYCHTPARSLYGYTTMTDWKSNPITRVAGMLINYYLRIIDVQIARNNVDFFIANSQETKRRIEKFYRLDSTVIYPPIEIDENKKFSNTAQLPEKNGYFLIVGRIAASKHVDLAVKTATKLGFSLKVVGSGKGIEYLRSIAGETVEFLGGVDDKTLSDLYENATALLYPAEDEDFGMVPIEAMGHGVPVIAHRSGGPLETIREGENGYFFDAFTIESLGSVIEKLLKTKWNKQKIYDYALQFSKGRFKKEISAFILECYNPPMGGGYEKKTTRGGRSSNS
ncbi:MAG: glycosyl transferase [Patescibacteria group bacterium]|nr:MAG: glycosyl transferase [Patescibacteria group bacterium]